MQTQLIRTITIICLVLGLAYQANAEVFHMPDPNLRAAILEQLGRPHDAPLRVKDMRLLQRLDAPDRGITDLTGLQFATRLERLHLRANAIVDLSPLASLTNLTILELDDNDIVDVTPVAHLTKLVRLILGWNQIVDVRPLAGLTQLRFLAVDYNRIVDLSPLDALAGSLLEFAYDTTCDMPRIPIQGRIDNRDYPSIFGRWSTIEGPPAVNRPELTGIENVALHDLRFSVFAFALTLRETDGGYEMAGALDRAMRIRDDIIALNPHAVTLVHLSVRTAGLDEFSPDSTYWLRDPDGDIFGDELNGVPQNNGYLDFTKPEVQEHIVQKALAVHRCGLYDGIMFDYWSEAWRVLGARGYFPYTLEEERLARVELSRKIREATRPDFLIMGNVNAQILPRTAPYVNGGFMETVLPFSQSDEDRVRSLRLVEDALAWLDANLREPRINGLEGWTIPDEPPDSPDNLRWMRVFTTMSLTHSNGYVSYYIRAQGGHYWYDFWDADLGRPVGDKLQLYRETDGLYIREFTNGWAVYNNSGEARIIELPEEVRAVASNLVNTEHALPAVDGEIYLKTVKSGERRVERENPADVNGDGVVNVLDLVVVAQAVSSGQWSVVSDVNGDGVVNVFDLVFVAEAF